MFKKLFWHNKLQISETLNELICAFIFPAMMTSCVKKNQKHKGIIIETWEKSYGKFYRNDQL